MRIALRADAHARIGWGHLKRCIALALALRAQGDEPAFFVARPADGAAALLAQAGLPMWPLDDPLDPAAMVAALAHWPAAVLVVDHYQIAAPWHRALRQATGAALVVVDDLADRPLDADLVIDHNPVADGAAKYAAVLQRPATLCIGPRYALIDAVYRDHPRCAPQPVLQSLGIFMGGTDPAHHSHLVWQACRQFAGWAGPIEIATTTANPNLAALQALAAQDAALRLQIDAPDLAGFHARHGLQIGAGGGALWERCCLGTPTLALVCADNQRQSLLPLAEAGVVQAFEAIDIAAVDRPALGAAIRALIDDPRQRAQLQQRALAWVDGQGAQRAAATIRALPGSPHGPLGD